MNELLKSRLPERTSESSIPAPPSKFVPVLAYLPVSELCLDACYLQQIVKRRVNLLVEYWDDRYFKPPTVSLRDGILYVIDGRHRVAAMKYRNPNDFLVPCELFGGLTLQEEVELANTLSREASLSRHTINKMEKEHKNK